MLIITDCGKYMLAANTLPYYHPFDSSKAAIKMQRGCKVDKISHLTAIFLKIFC